METDVTELERLHREVGALIWDYLRRRVNDPAVAEELFQETFVVIARDIAALKGVASKRAWVLGIARNLLREHLRRAKRQRRTSITVEQVPATPSVEDPRLEPMRQAIARLPARLRDVLELRLGRDLSYAEIAEALSIPIGTVRSRMHHAIRALRQWAAACDLEAILEARP